MLFVLQIVFKKNLVQRGKFQLLGKLLVKNFILLSDARYMGCYFSWHCSGYLASLKMGKNDICPVHFMSCGRNNLNKECVSALYTKNYTDEKSIGYS